MKKNDFIWLQGSTYASEKPMSHVCVQGIINELIKDNPVFPAYVGVMAAYYLGEMGTDCFPRLCGFFRHKVRLACYSMFPAYAGLVYIKFFRYFLRDFYGTADVVLYTNERGSSL